MPLAQFKSSELSNVFHVVVCFNEGFHFNPKRAKVVVIAEALPKIRRALE